MYTSFTNIFDADTVNVLLKDPQQRYQTITMTYIYFREYLFTFHVLLEAVQK